MSKGDTFENDLLKLIFNATAIANLADNAATSPASRWRLCAGHRQDLEYLWRDEPADKLDSK